MSRKKVEPVIVHKIGVSGQVKDSFMGVMINNETHVIPGIDTLDQIRNLIKTKEIFNYIK